MAEVAATLASAQAEAAIAAPQAEVKVESQTSEPESAIVAASVVEVAEDQAKSEEVTAAPTVLEVVEPAHDEAPKETAAAEVSAAHSATVAAMESITSEETKTEETLVPVVESTAIATELVPLVDVAPAISAPAVTRRTVTLKRSAGKLGLKIASTGDSQPAKIIGVTEGGLADKSGQLFVGDYILCINGQPVLLAPYDSIIKSIASKDEVVFTVDSKLPEAPKEVIIERPAGVSYGLVLVTDDERHYCFIKEAKHGSIAEATGRIAPNDVILKIGGERTLNISHKKIMAKMSLSGNRLVLLLTPEEDLPFFLEAEEFGRQFESQVQPPVQRSTPNVNVSTSILAGEINKWEQDTVQPASDIVTAEASAKAHAVAPVQTQAKVAFLLENAALAETTNDTSSVLPKVTTMTTDSVSTAPVDSPASVVADKEAVKLVHSRREVKLEKKPGVTLGMKISSDKSSRGTRVSGLSADGLAGKSGKIFVGDVLFKVNNELVYGVSHETVMKAFTSSSIIDLVLYAPDALELSFHDHRKVKMARGPEGLGMRIASDAPFPYATVSGLQPGGLAFRTGQIHEKDIILEINDEPMHNMPADSIVAALKASSSINLLLANKAERTVVLDRSTGMLGMLIEVNKHGHGVRVANLSPGGVAEASGAIKPGDYIVSINGAPMLHATHDEAVEAIKAQQLVTLVLTNVAPHREDSTVIQPLLPENDVQKPEATGADNVSSIVLSRVAGSFGLKVTTHEIGKGAKISGVTPGGAADLSGKIVVGNSVLRVNSKNVIFSSHDEVVEAIRSSGDVLTLVVAAEVTDAV